MRRLVLSCLATLLAGAPARADGPPPTAPPPEDPAAVPAPDDDSDDADDPPATDGAAPAPTTPDAPTPEVPSPAPKARKHKHKAKKPKADLPLLHEKLARRWMFLAPIDAELAAGWADGWQTRRVDGALVEGEVAIEPQLRYRRGRFRLRLPLSARQRATIGFHLPETRLALGLVASGKPRKDLELSGSARVVRVLRPGWADYYQPLFDPTSVPPYEPDGDLRPTDRYSSTTVTGAAGVSWSPLDEVDLSLGAELEEKREDHDPRFDPVLSPTHLTPNDRRRAGASLRLRTEPVKNRLHLNLSLGVDAYDYHYAFARDAGTGLTHSALGGDAGNPLQSFLRTSVAPDASLLIHALKTRVSLHLRWVHNDDRFRGYYTWDAWGGALGLRVRPAPDVKVELDYDLEVRRYTHDGYQPGPTHAPLDGGDAVRRRVSHELGLALSWSLDDGRFEPFVDLRWSRLDDSMPDYVPWLNPPGEPYAVDFDEPPSWTVRAGVRLSL
ncbi:MAG: hypothetical protein U1F43_22975 [Myxococcota bacterium]